MSTKYPSHRFPRSKNRGPSIGSNYDGPVGSGQWPTEYLTHARAVTYLSVLLGAPISLASVPKLRSRGKFPEPSFWWGRRALYTREALRAWVKSKERRTRPTRRNKGGLEVASVASPDGAGKRRRSATIIQLRRKSDEVAAAESAGPGITQI